MGESRDDAAGDRKAIARRVDHLVFATPDLESSRKQIAELLGVNPVDGGQHRGRGTRNALVSLGPRAYLEVVGPDPDQPMPAEPRWFGIDDLSVPRLVTWAATTDNLDRDIARAAHGGMLLGPAGEGGRLTPAGEALSWRFSDPNTVVAAGIAPFLIDWGTSPHPADNLPGGCTLLDLRAEHPRRDVVMQLLSALDLELQVLPGPEPALIATIHTARGVVELR